MKTKSHTLKWKVLSFLLLLGWTGIAQAQEPVQEQTQAQEPVQTQRQDHDLGVGLEWDEQQELERAASLDEWAYQTSGEYKVTSSKTLTGTINLSGNLTLHGTGDVKINKGEFTGSMFKSEGHKLTLIGSSTEDRFTLDGCADITQYGEGGASQTDPIGNHLNSDNNRPGYIIELKDNSSLEMTNVRLQRCWANANQHSGAILAENQTANEKTITMTNCVIRGCYSVRAGSAITFPENSRYNATFTNCYFHHNRSKGDWVDPEDPDHMSYGGTIRSFGGTKTKLTVTGCEIHHNWTGWSGGGICWNGSGDDHRTKLTVTNTNIYNNHADHWGGGIYCGGSFSAISNSNIHDNYAGDGGGGISVASYAGPLREFGGGGTEVTLKNHVHIYNNTTPADGGGVHYLLRASDYTGFEENWNPIATNSYLHIESNCEINGNSADRGGGVFVYDGFPKVHHCEDPNHSGLNTGVLSREFKISGGSIHDNTASTKGGGVCIIKSDGHSPASDFANNADAGTLVVHLTSGSVYNNKCTGDGGGGGIAVHDRFQDPDGTPNGRHNPSACLVYVDGNIQVYSNRSARNGGGVYLGYGDMTMTQGAIGTSGANIAGQTSTHSYGGNGGGIAVIGGNFTKSGGTVAYNQAVKVGDNGGNGGGVYVTKADKQSKGNATINSSANIFNNTAVHGGGFYVTGDGNASVSGNSTISTNFATLGGGFYVTGGGNASVSGNSTITGNTASSNGGGFYVTGGSTTTVTGGLISDNTASNGSGGGAYVTSNSAVTMSGTFKRNHAYRPGDNGGNGGGFYVTGQATVTVGGTVGGSDADKNTAAYCGGGFCLAGGATLDLNGTVSYNEAQYGGGGYVTNGNATLRGGTNINHNKASIRGGGFYVREGGADIQSGATISYNEVTTIEEEGGDGGGFFVSGNSNVTLTNCTVSHNTVPDAGGGFYVGKSSSGNSPTVTLKGIVDHNTAGVGGGGYVAGGNVTLQSGTNIHHNQAITDNGGSGEGGGLKVYQGNVTYENGDVADNTAKDGGGLYVSGGGNLTYSSGNVIRNTASQDGGGIYVYNGNITCSSEAVHVTSNTASRNGGGVYVDGGTINYTNGTVNLNRATYNGGGVYVTGSGTINCNGGAITHNRATYNGGGVFVYDGGHFNGNGSAITYDTVTLGNGGGVCVHNAELTLEGSTIISNNGAVNGGGIAVTVEGTGTSSFTYTNGTISANTATGNGGGLYAEGGTVTLNNGAIGIENNGNTATNGGGIYLGGGTLNHNGGTVGYNTASSDGGGMYLNAGTTTINGSTININNNGAVDGAGIYANNNFSLSNGTVISNVASHYGGGVYVNAGTTTITGGNIGTSGNANTAQNGGGVYAAGGTLNHTGGNIGYNTATVNGGGLYVNDGTVTVDGGTVNNNGAVDGAGIYANNNFSLSSGNVIGNAATDNGGGLYVNAGQTTISGGNVGVSEGGNSAQNGGGVYVGGGTLEYISGEVSYNTATTNGGGIYMGGTTFDYLNGAILNNSATDGGGLYVASGTTTIASCNIGTSGNGNTASNNGGGVYLADGSLVYNNGNIQYNTATNDGGGIYVVGGSLNKKGTINNNTAQRNGGGLYAGGGAITLTSGYIRDNQAVDGGGVYVLNDDIVTYNGGTVTDNKASNDGGGIYFANQQTITLDEAINYTSNTATANGGGVYMDGGSLTYDNGNVGKNQAANGGGIYVKSGTTTIQSGTLGGSGNGNTATNDGGGIYVDGGTIKFTDGTVSHNTATANGGGIYMGGVTFTYEDGSILKNEAAKGGGVYIASGATTITNCSIGASGNGNTAQYGGGVYLNAGSMDYKGGNIQYNTATVDGGGIYSAGGTLNHHGGITNNNNATHDGGGIYAKDGDVTLTNGTICDNNATNDGGGIFVLNSGIVTYNGGTVSGNKATHDGGGIYFDNSQTITLDGLVTYIQNTAVNDGGGIYMDGGTLTYAGGIVQKNQAVNGGGVYVKSGTTTIQSGTLGGSDNGNTATSDGGGIYVDGGSLTFNDGTIGNNLAQRNGGGIYLNGDTFTYSNGTVGSNTATANGGGIYVNTGTMNQTGGIVANNSASSSSVEVPETDLFEDFETGPEGGFTLEGWEFGGNAEWTFVEGGANQNSSFCIKSGAIDDSQQTDLSITFYLPENGTVSFWRKVSSQSNNDYLRFYVDNLQKGYWSGNVSWAKVEYELLAGRHTFRWTYVKNASNTSGNDCAWIDDIHFGYIPGYTLPVGSGDGGGLYVNNGEAVITGCNYSNNEAVNGGGIYTNGGATTFSGGTIGGLGNSNTATANGGGIYSNGGTTSLTKGTICFNEAVNGGGMYVNNGTVGCSNTISIVSNAASSHGGGIYSNGGETTLTGGTVGTDGGANTAENGGGIYVNGGTVNQNGGDVTYNSASGTTVTQEPEVVIFEDFESANFNHFGPDGWQNDPTQPWTIVAGGPHSSSWCAKAPRPSSGTTTSLSITLDIPVAGYIYFWRRTSGANGNFFNFRFYIDGTQKLSHSNTNAWECFCFPVDAGSHTFKWSCWRYFNTLENCCWIDNIHFSTIPAGQPVTSGNGGGIYVNGGTLNQNGGTVAHNTVGGTAAAEVPEVNVYEDFETGDFSKFDYGSYGDGNWTNWIIDEEGAHGGNYCAKSGSIGSSSSTALKVLVKVPADGTIVFYRKCSGAGESRFYINDVEQVKWSGTSDWTQVSYPVSAGWNVFKWDHSTSWGNVGDGGFLWIDDIQFGPVIPSYTVAAGDGGGIYVLGGNFNQEGGIVAYNTAPNNGGGFLAEGGVSTISGGIYHNNEATKGGGLYVHGGTVTVNDGTVGGDSEADANRAQEGGGIAVGGGRLLREGGHLIYNGGNVTYNTATTNGGGFYAEGGETSITGGTFGNNESNNGGGMYVKDGTVGCSGTFSVVNNTATTHGGGLYTEGGETTISGGTIGSEGNANTAVNGGGIFMEGGVLTCNSGSVAYNLASTNGGGLYANGGVATIWGGTIGNNGAVDGAGVYVNDGALDVNGGSIVSNAATNYGGGIYTIGGQTTVTGGTIGSEGNANTAIKGGGLYVTGGEVNINGGIIDSNEAVNGAGIYANVEFTLNGGTLQYNSASGDGGGIYIPENVAVYLKGSTILTGNHVPATFNGGGIYMNGDLYVGGGADPYMKCEYNYANDGVLTPEEITKETRNNIYLPSRLKHVTLRSDISGKDANGYYKTRIGITANVTIDDDRVPVLYVENQAYEPWLFNLIADVQPANGAVFDDKEFYIAVHTRKNIGEYDMQYLYFSQCWTTVVNRNPNDDTDTYPLPTGVTAHWTKTGDTYHIYTNSGLAWFSSIVNGLNGQTADRSAKAVLEADVDMSRFLWAPIGAITGYESSSSTFGESDSEGYTGEFNGQGYVIHGITNGYLTGLHRYGLFGSVSTGGIVKNTFLDAYANLLVNSDVYYMGGIAGECNGGTIYNCEARGDMDLRGSAATSYAGGIVGRLSAGQVHSCMAIPVLEGSNATMGGLAGYVAAGTSVKNSFANNWFVNNGSGSKGGLVGVTYGTVENCYAQQRRPETSSFGWFTGAIGNGSVIYSYAPMNMMGFDYKNGNDGTTGIGGHGNYDVTALVSDKYGFAHIDQQITLVTGQSNSYVVNGPITNDGDLGGLQATLNKWVREHNQQLGDDDIKYSLWTRTMGSAINNDYPVLAFNDFVCTGTKDGIFMDYKSDLNAMIGKYNVETPEFSDFNAVITDSVTFEHGQFMVEGALPTGSWTWTNADGTTVTWTNDATYPWIICPKEGSGQGVHGDYCIKNGNVTQANRPSRSTITVTTEFPYGYIVSFYALCNPVSGGDYGTFSIDGVGQRNFNDGAQHHTFHHYSYRIPAGTHTLSWTYCNNTDYVSDNFYIDDITFAKAIEVYDICLYDSNPSVLNTTTEERTSIYIKPNVCLLQEETSKDRSGGTINARVGIVLDNSSGSSDDPFMAYDWHMFSPALQAVPMGLKYPYIDFGDPSYNTNYNPEDYTGFVYVANSAPESSNYYHVADNFLGDDSYYADGIPQAVYRDAIKMDAPKPQWDTRDGKVGYFPTDAPYGTWRGQTPQQAVDNGEESLVGSYDFYCFDERSYHWINFKRNCFYYTEGSAKAQGDVTVYPDHWQEDSDEHGFHANINYRNETEMIPGKGYLVAVSSPSMLMADGVLNNGTISRTVSAAAPDGYFTGTNLVGNPYQSYLDFDLFAANATNAAVGANTYYILDADAKGYLAYTQGATPQEEDWLGGVVAYTAGRYLHPHQGFFIKVNEGAEEVVFTNSMRSVSVQAPFRSEQSYPLVNLICTDGEGRNDFATVELARPEMGGGKKAKGLRTGDASLWVHLTDNEDYHIAFAPLGTKAVPVHFKAYADGVYTLSWNMHNVDFNYIHLIDNLTGADIDCLAEEQYLFEGHTGDYKSRFMLVFDFMGNEAPEVPEEPEDP